MSKPKKSKRKLKFDESPTSSVKQQRFLAAFAQTGIVAAAARIAGCDRKSHSYWLENDPNYPELFAEAKEEACDIIRAEIQRRAVMGIDRPIFYKGQKVATVKEYSDRLLEFLAKSRMPEFRDRLDVNQTGTQEVKLVIDENWYGNNAHDLVAEVAAASSPAADE